MDRDILIDALAGVLAARTDVVAAYLFGSVARGEARPDSDVDVGVVLAAGAPRELPAFGALGDLHADLEEASDREVDLVVLNDAPVDLVHRVLRDGVLLYESDANRRIAFEARARSEYFDMQPILALYRRTVLQSL